MSRRDQLLGLAGRSREVVVAAALVGAVTGFAVAGFERLTVDGVFDGLVAHLPLGLLAFAPGVGLAIAALWLRGPGRGLSPATSDAYLEAFHHQTPLGLRALV